MITRRFQEAMGAVALVLAVVVVPATAIGQRAVRSAPAARTEAPAAAEGVVNLNTATAEQLMLLPGVGPAKADAIVQARAREPFASVDQVLRVRGIGRAMLRKLRPFLTVRGETTLRQRVRAESRTATSPVPETQGPGLR